MEKQGLGVVLGRDERGFRRGFAHVDGGIHQTETRTHRKMGADELGCEKSHRISATVRTSSWLPKLSTSAAPRTI